MAKPITKAVLPVAGLGTRFLPATKVLPKEMLPIVDMPLIQYAIDEAVEAGIDSVMLVTGRGKSIIEDHFDHSHELEQILRRNNKEEDLKVVRDFPAAGQLVYTRQQQPLGLGHAVWCARQFVANEPFAVLLPDDLVKAAPGCLKQMISAYEQVGGNLVASVEVDPDQTNRYGILDVASDNGPLVEANGIIEKPSPEDSPSTLSVIGRYILQPEIFSYLDRQKKGAQNEIQLTDAIAATLPGVSLHGFRFEGVRFDCGTKAGFVLANVAFALDRKELGPELKQSISKLMVSK